MEGRCCEKEILWEVKRRKQRAGEKHGTLKKKCSFAYITIIRSSIKDTRIKHDPLVIYPAGFFLPIKH